MSYNRASRKGIGVPRSDYDAITDLLRSVGCQFAESVGFAEKYDPEYAAVGRRRMRIVSFETTSLIFNVRGEYLGRTYMSRDECDYFTPKMVSE